MTGILFKNLLDSERVGIDIIAERWNVERKVVLSLCKKYGAIEAAFPDVMCLENVQFPTDQKGETETWIKDSYKLPYVHVSLPVNYIREIIITGILSIESIDIDADFGQEQEAGSFFDYSPAVAESFSIGFGNLYIKKTKVLELEQELGIFSEGKPPDPISFQTASFQTAQGVEWYDVKIHFITLYKVMISFGPKNYERNYNTLGFRDSRKQAPKKGWLLLFQMALGDNSYLEQKNISKEVSDLQKALKQIFPNIAGNPFKSKVQKLGWPLRINLTVQENFSDQYRG